MDVHKAVTFVFEDNQRVSKTLVGTLISLIPFLGSITLSGYSMSVLRNVRAESPGPLPGWDRLGEHFVDGLLFPFLFDHIGEIIIARLLVWAAGLVVTTALGLVIGASGIVPICGWVIASLLGLLLLPVGVWLMLFASYLHGEIGRAGRAATPAV